MTILKISFIQPENHSISIEYHDPNDLNADALFEYFVRAALSFGYMRESILESLLGITEDMEYMQKKNNNILKGE